MNFVEAGVMANRITEKCGMIILRRHKKPEPRLLKDVGINEEGYCIFCEDYRSYKSAVQMCIILFVKTRELDKTEQGNNLIIHDRV
jgi:hypothetical protein